MKYLRFALDAAPDAPPVGLGAFGLMEDVQKLVGLRRVQVPEAAVMARLADAIRELAASHRSAS